MSAQDLQSLTAEDGLLTNMLISGNTQGIAQFVTGVYALLENQAAEETLNQNDTTGGSGEMNFEDSETKKARIEVCEKHGKLRQFSRLVPGHLSPGTGPKWCYV